MTRSARSVLALLLVLLTASEAHAQKRMRLRTASGSAIVPVGCGANLQTAINTAVSAADGRTLLLAAGCAYSGNYTLKAYSGPVITIKGGGSLPTSGTRVDPTWVANMADWTTLQSPSTDPVITTEAGANNWSIVGVSILPNVNLTAGGYGVNIGDNNETILANYPDHITIDRVLLRGNAATGQLRGFAFHTRNGVFTNNYIDRIMSNDNDAQALFVFGPGPYFIDNNYLNSTGENVLFGGATSGLDAHPTGTFTHNDLEKDASWFPSKLWSVKNIFEMKAADGWTIKYNDIHNHWPDSQTGYTVLFTPRNQDNNDAGTVVANIDFSCNRIYDVSSAFNISGDDDIHTSARTHDIGIRNNLVIVSAATWGGDGRIALIIRSPTNVEMDNNTFVGDGGTMLFLDEDTAHASATGFVFTDNLWRHNTYGIGGSGTSGSGTLSLNTYFASYTFSGNVFGDDTGTSYPNMGANTRISDAAWQAIFTNFNGGAYTGGDFTQSTYPGVGRNFGC